MSDEIKSNLSYAVNVAQTMRSAANDVGVPEVCRSAGRTDVAVQEKCVAVYGSLARTANETQSLFSRFASYVERSAEEFEALDQNQKNAWMV